MKHYIYTTEKAAKDYDKAVCDKHNFSEGTNFANPHKHPSKQKWAIAASPRVELENKQAVELSKDWFKNSI